MKIDFNRQINRKHTDCAKWDGQGGDYIPLWIADMDLPVAEPVLEALKNRLEHPFWGIHSLGKVCIRQLFLIMRKDKE